MLITRRSPISGKTNVRDINVTQEQLDSWHYDGIVIQEAMPKVSAEDREFIMTGILPEEWDVMFDE